MKTEQMIELGTEMLKLVNSMMYGSPSTTGMDSALGHIGLKRKSLMGPLGLLAAGVALGAAAGAAASVVFAPQTKKLRQQIAKAFWTEEAEVKKVVQHVQASTKNGAKHSHA